MKCNVFLSISKNWFLFLAILFTQNVFGTNYYVSPSGNNSNDGLSINTAFKTINYAVNFGALTGGDIVFINEGVYNERVIMLKSGISDASRITIKNYSSIKPVIDGTGLLWDYIDGVSGLFEIRSRYVTLDGVKVINVVANADAAGILVRGPSTSFVTVIRCVTNNTRTSGIAIWGRTFEADYSGATDIRIEACDISGAVNNGYQEHLTIAQGVDRFTICWNKVHDQTLPGKEPNLPIGIDAKINIRNGKIYGNEVWNLYKANGIYVDAWDSEAYNIEIFNNIIHDVDYTGIPVGAEEGGTVHDIKVYNNLIYKVGANGLSLNQENNTLGNNKTTSIYNVSFYNNTVYGCGFYAAHVLNKNTPGCSFKNNIFSQNKWSNAITVYSENKNNLLIENNVTNGEQNAWLPGMEIALGVNNISLDPLFAWIGGNNFRLQPNSPAINAATSTLIPINDLDWTSRPSGGIADIGAYEFLIATTLPVSLLRLEVKKQAQLFNKVTWQVANGKNFHSFELEKSINNKEWKKLTTLNFDNGKNLNFEFIDKNKNSGINYYRLKMVEQNNSFNYSKIVSINNSAENAVIYPNPVYKTLKISGLIKNDFIQIFDLNGKLILTKSFILNSHIELDIENLPMGTYIIKTKNQSFKFQKL